MHCSTNRLFSMMLEAYFHFRDPIFGFRGTDSYYSLRHESHTKLFRFHATESHKNFC